MNAKDRMKEWKKLPENTIAWETFKRLVSQFGMDEGIKKAQKIIEKKLSVRQSENLIRFLK